MPRCLKVKVVLMGRAYNFSAGPAMLPEEVMKRAAEELLSYGDSGIPVAEICHRSEEYDMIMSNAKASLRQLLNIPSNYKILFMRGGATEQFSAIPLNLLSEHKCADYIITGQVSDRAMKEAKKYGDIAIAATSSGATPVYSTVPQTEKSDFRPDADYVYLCFNNTIYGTRFHYVPKTNNVPLVADMTTSLLSEPVDVSKFGVIFAGPQANTAACGMTIVIIREDLLGNARSDTPLSLNYKSIAADNSMYTSPSAENLYIANLIFDWLISLGGLEEVKRRNERKASIIYDYFDDCKGYYTVTVDKKCRSTSNIIFTTGERALDEKFASDARSAGLYNLEGHPSVGGLRASMYNSMPYEGAQQLLAFLKRFAVENPKL